MRFEKYDEKVRTLADAVLAAHRTDAEKTMEYCQKLIDIGNAAKDPALLGFGNFYISESSYFSNRPDRFFEYATIALSYLDQADDFELIASCYNLFGIWAMNKGNSPLAQDYYFSALKYCRQYHLADVWIKVSVNLGVLNNLCGRYEDARVYLEEALNYLALNCQSSPNYHNYIFAVYENLGNCFTMLKQYSAVEKIIRMIHEEHWEHMALEDRLLSLCMEAQYYNRRNDISKRDSCIAAIQAGIQDENMTIMDMFEDYRSYALMLIEIDKREEFWHLVDTIESLINSCSLVRMRLRLEDLKLRFYRKNNLTEDYLKHAAVYYELSDALEADTANMMSDALNLRRKLEDANIEKLKVETQNRLLLLRSETDPLTGLYNRFRMDSYSEKLFRSCKESKTPVAVEILDIDYFKQYNDNYGHQSGDACLVKVARVLKQIAEDHNAFCARYGGDEFILIYSGMNRDEIVKIAAEIKQAVTALKLEHNYSEAEPFITVSQGICRSIPRKKNRMWDFLHAADDYLYKVKSLSRNSYCIGDVRESGDLVLEEGVNL